MRTKYKQWAVDYLEAHKENEFELSDEPKEIERIENFIKEKDTYLEIGPGKGQFIIEIAKKFPMYNYLVIELNSTISGIALRAIDEAGLTNVKLINGNFYKLANLMKNSSFAGIFLNFSDPWPKKRHVKRRLTHPLFLVEYAKILADGKKIYFKTDNDGLYLYSKEQFENYGWETELDLLDYSTLVDFDAKTEFETKFLNQGVKIKRMVLVRNKNTITTVKEEDL